MREFLNRPTGRYEDQDGNLSQSTKSCDELDQNNALSFHHERKMSSTKNSLRVIFQLNYTVLGYF